MHFLIDADLPRSTAQALIDAGHVAVDVRDIGLRQAPDSIIAEYAKRHNLCLLSGDFDFADIRNYVPSEYFGIVILKVHKDATAAFIIEILKSFLSQLNNLGDLRGKLAMVEVDRIRIRAG
jgi:predicted nuclease of predicted toxin-antitoxin system